MRSCDPWLEWPLFTASSLSLCVGLGRSIIIIILHIHSVPDDRLGHVTSTQHHLSLSLCVGLGRSIIIIFKLFTLDGWYKFYKSFIEVHEVYSSSIFIFTWVFLSAFLLGNLFPALLITNFQRLRGQVRR